jgi:hypothetical protein
MEPSMNILAIVSGEYGKRHVENIRKHGPQSWRVDTWHAPAVLPPVIDDPADHLPEGMPPADLILSFAENKSVAELLPEIAARTGAKAVVVAVDNETWLPHGLARQLHAWLAELGVACAAPRPLCSLTEMDFGVTRHARQTYESALISEFAHYFGMPELSITVDPESRSIAAAEVLRDSVCGCARYVAHRLAGLSLEEAEEKASLLHHHYPCLASMVKLDDFDHETLMIESGNLLKENIGKQLR